MPRLLSLLVVTVCSCHPVSPAAALRTSAPAVDGRFPLSWPQADDLNAGFLGLEVPLTVAPKAPVLPGPGAMILAGTAAACLEQGGQLAPYAFIVRRATASLRAFVVPSIYATQ